MWSRARRRRGEEEGEAGDKYSGGGEEMMAGNKGVHCHLSMHGRGSSTGLFAVTLVLTNLLTCECPWENAHTRGTGCALRIY